MKKRKSVLNFILVGLFICALLFLYEFFSPTTKPKTAAAKTTTIKIVKIKNQSDNQIKVTKPQNKEKEIIKKDYQPQPAELDESDEPDYLGKIYYPDVNISMKIVKGVGKQNLYRGAATNKTIQTMGEGNYVLCSHAMPNDKTIMFGPLLKAKKEQKVYITDGKKVYTYKVFDLFSVTPDRIDILDDKQDKTWLTLYTCETDAGTSRWVVRGYLIDEKPLKTASEKIQNAFTATK